MTNETDRNLARLFAEHAEALDGAAFSAQVSRRIAHRRNLEQLGDLGFVIAAGAAAVALAPFVLEAAAVITDGSRFLTSAAASFAVTPIAWFGAGIAGLLTIISVRL